MRSLILSAALVLWIPAWSAPVVFRLASLPATAAPGQKLMLCAANVGNGALDVTLEFLNVSTGDVVAQNTMKLAALGSTPAGGSPCITIASDLIPAGTGQTGSVMSKSFVGGAPAVDGQAMIVGVALVRRPWLSFREPQVTASIQVLAPEGNGAMRTVETIPLTRTAHPSEAAPVYAPAPADGGHHK